jgi:hypothetical protein
MSAPSLIWPKWVSPPRVDVLPEIQQHYPNRPGRMERTEAGQDRVVPGSTSGGGSHLDGAGQLRAG